MKQLELFPDKRLSVPPLDPFEDLPAHPDVMDAFTVLARHKIGFSLLWQRTIDIVGYPLNAGQLGVGHVR